MKLRFLLALSIACATSSCRTPVSGEHVILLPAAPAGSQITSAAELAGALERRWSLSRVEEFTDAAIPLKTKGRQGLKLDFDDWQGELHKGQKKFSQIYFCAFVTDRKPTHFAVFAINGGKTWNIEAGKLSLIFQTRTVEKGGTH